MHKTIRAVLATCLLTAVSIPALADGGGVSFTRNRMVYAEGERAISLAVVNHGSMPYLIQAGVSAQPGKNERAPFIVTPPLFRLDGNARNMMRIVGSGEGLPKDRESVFYFYASAIPGQASAPEDNAEGKEGAVGARLSIAMKTILKLFWRPKGLPVTIDQAHGMMHFVRRGNDVVIRNPTPYYQSFAQLSFDGVAQDLNQQVSMVAPMSELVFPAGKAVSKVTWSVMTDYGGATKAVTQAVEPS